LTINLQCQWWCALSLSLQLLTRPFFEIATLQLVGGITHKLRPRLFWQVCITKLIAWSFYTLHIWANSADFHFQVQTMSDRFQDLLFFNTISCIFLSKKNLLDFLTNFLNSFQSFNNLKTQYTFSFKLYSLFHYTLKHLVILIYSENLFQKDSEIVTYS